MTDMLDNYLIAQALGLEWNGWTMIGLTIAEIILGFIFLITVLAIIDYVDRRRIS